MNHQLVSIPAEPRSEPQSAGSVRLHGNWLVLARLTWILISTTAKVMLIASLVTHTWWYWTLTEADCYDAATVVNNSTGSCLASFQRFVQILAQPRNQSTNVGSTKLRAQDL